MRVLIHLLSGFFLASALLVPSIAIAQNLQGVRIQAIASTPCKKAKPTEPELAAGMALGKREILRQYMIQAPPARQQLLAQIRGRFEQDPDVALSDVQLLAQQVDTKTKTLTVSVAGLVDEKAIDALFPRPAETENYICLIFVARRQSSVKSFSPEVMTGDSTLEASLKRVDQETGTGPTAVSIGTKTDKAIITKGATVLRSDHLAYALAPSDTLDTAMEGVLAERNFKMVPSATVRKRSQGAFDSEKFVQAFQTGHDVSPELIQNAAEACGMMRPKLPFYGYGTLTLEPAQRDPVSGRTRVNIQVYAKVIDCRSDFATTAASVEAIQYAGLGESETEAETVALTGAAKMAAKMIADKLNAKAIF